ncbi:MAG TPA: dTDP-4-dehydrorhamnose 3,5-epimerase family protein [Terriglobia bacterium]|nr:dTDP-4-dehydrorhamnose 3,5-epimerase family protein [Terriglobia bacterium]
MVKSRFVSKARIADSIEPNRTRGEVRRIAKANGLELGILRHGSGGLGTIVRSQTTPGCIAGLRLAPLEIHPDDRGYFEEVCRLGVGLAESFRPPKQVQVSAALSYPGTVKAVHYHLHQTDLWTPAMGQFQVMLYDLRVDSPTFGQLNTLYIGTLRPLQLLIPPGVGHGYKVLGTEPALLVYATDQFYDPSDEGRIPWNDPDIGYDWETQRK